MAFFDFLKQGLSRCIRLYFLGFIFFIFLMIVVIPLIFLPLYKFPSSVKIGDTNDGYVLGDELDEDLVWFLQISDTHINEFSDKRAGVNFRTFCSQTVQTIQPKFVLHTGDITDGRATSFDSGQNKKDWDLYQSILQDENLYDKNLWIELRGNHDTYSVGTWFSESNFFRDQSVWGPSLPSSDFRAYEHIHVTPSNSRYRFVALDMTPEYGFMGLSFNLWGYLYDSTFEEMKKILSSSQPNHTIIMSHYPKSASAIFPESFNDIAKEHRILAFLCGHYHQPNFWSIPEGNYLELELEDFVRSNVYRVMAFDGDIFSFTDVVLNQWPVVLITNPTNAEFLSVNEPLHRIRQSTHIRVLVFAPEEFQTFTVRIKLDEGNFGQMIKQGNSSLWTFPWTPSDFSKGLHTITVEVISQDNRVLESVKKSFSVDGTRKFYGLFFQTIASELDVVGLLWGITLLMYFVGLTLTVGPQIFVFILKKMEKIEEWESTLNQMIRYDYKLDDEAPDVSIFLWQIRVLIWQYSKIPFPAVIGATGMLLYFVGGPLLFGRLGGQSWGALFIYGATIRGTIVHPYAEITTITNIFLLMFMFPWLALFSRVAFRDFFIEKRSMTYGSSIRNFLKPELPYCGSAFSPHPYLFGSLTSILLILLMIFCFVLIIFLSTSFDVTVLFLSPIIWFFVVGFVSLFFLLKKEFLFLKQEANSATTKQKDIPLRDH